MNPLILFVAFALMRDARAIVELDCSDNATCIDNMAKEVIRSVRQQRTVKLFNVLTIEPLRTRQARMARSMDTWLETFLDGNAFSFDWNDYTFRVSQADDSNALDLAIYQGRTAKDVSDPNGKKSSGKNEEEKEEDKTPKLPGRPMRIRRRQKKKVMQVIIPLLFGMKSAGVVLFAMAVVTVLTLKAFFASKVALFVTAGMALKKLYETYGTGVGLQNHPYLYSQYPIDFPSASSHAYSVSGVSPQFASPEMYSPTAMGANAQSNEIMHQSDVTAQQSQQAPTLLVNSTRAAERWDGKSKLLKFLEPLYDGVRNILDPIVNVFYDAIPATVRGLNSVVTTSKSADPDDDLDELEVIKPKQILVPQPRNIARKMTNRKNRYRPKKYTELKINLDRLKNNKDLHDYIKTKKYKYNYPNTYYYPRVKYFVNPNNFYKPNNSRLLPYAKDASQNNVVDSAVTITPIYTIDTSDWKPIIAYNHTFPKNDTRKRKRLNKKRNKKRHNRSKRSVDLSVNSHNGSVRSIQDHVNDLGLFVYDILHYFLNTRPMSHLSKLIVQSQNYTETRIGSSTQSDAPAYYSFAHNMVMMSLDLMESLFEAKKVSPKKIKRSKKNKYKKNKKNEKDSMNKQISNCTLLQNKVEHNVTETKN